MRRNKNKTKRNTSFSTPDFIFDPAEMVDSTIQFLKDEKGLMVDSVEDLEKAREWVRTTDPDNLMLGEPTGDPFDIYIGSLRRNLLLQAIDIRLAQMKAAA